MPIDTVDCCKMDGRAICAMLENSIVENQPQDSLEGQWDISFKNKRNAKIAEIPCAIRVAQATPATPICRFFTIKISNKILKIEEKINKNNGILDRPKALNIADRILYMNKNGNPRK